MDVHQLKVLKEEYRVRGELLTESREVLRMSLPYPDDVNMNCDHSVGMCLCPVLDLIEKITRHLDGK